MHVYQSHLALPVSFKVIGSAPEDFLTAKSGAQQGVTIATGCSRSAMQVEMAEMLNK